MLRVMNSINDEMGYVGNDDLGFGKTGLERMVRLIGFEDLNYVVD